MGRVKGNALIEVILSFMILMIITNCTSLIFRNLNKVHFDYSNDLSYCLYSISQEITLAKCVEVYNDKLILYNTDQPYEFTLNQQRIVRTPGFNIYLNHVDNLSFSHDSTYVYINIQRGNENAKFKIGVYKRPIPRNNQSSECDNLYDDSEFNEFNGDNVE